MSLCPTNIQRMPAESEHTGDGPRIPHPGPISVVVVDGWDVTTFGNPAAPDRVLCRWDDEYRSIAVDIHPENCDVVRIFGENWFASVRQELERLWPVWREQDTAYLVSCPRCESDGTFELPSRAHVDDVVNSLLRLARSRPY